MRDALGLIEVGGLAPALVILDTLDKAAEIELIQVEINDMLGVIIRVRSTPASLRAGLAATKEIAEQMRVSYIGHAINAPADWPAMVVKPEHSPLLEQDVVYFPKQSTKESTRVSESTNHNGPFALGLIETQGFTAVLEALDAAAKAGNVEVVGREKLGGGYVTVIFKGDVAAVKAAVEAGKGRVEGLGKLIAAHVIARPSDAVLSLLPKS
jgi:microcompartment protein CcmL/EutN